MHLLNLEAQFQSGALQLRNPGIVSDEREVLLI